MMTTHTTVTSKIMKQLGALLTTIAALFLFGEHAYTQVIKNDNAAAAQSAQKPADTSKAKRPLSVTPFMDNLPEGAGATAGMMSEYDQIISKYKTGEDKKWQRDFFIKITDTEYDRLQEIYLQMNKEQRSKQEVVFRTPPPPLPRQTPTAAQFESFKNSSVYGVWIDGKKVSNTELDKYSPADFSQTFVSRLYGNARKDKIYKYQVDLMTKAYYKDYYNKTIANKKPLMAILWRSNKA